MFCYKCGKEVPEGVAFCSNCGAALINPEGMRSGPAGTITSSASNAVNKLANHIDAATGGEGHVELRFRDFFINVFKKHTEDEQNEIFACGSIRTTPAPKDIAKEWPRPWYYSRIFITLLISTILLYLLYNNLGVATILPGLMFVGAMLGVCPVLMFFYEVNSPRNISFITVLEMFFLGGCLSIVFSVLLNTLIPGGSGEMIPSILTGVVEETGKALAIAFFISRYKDKHYVLNGLLIGSSVGAGFAVLETAGYILAASLELYETTYTYGVTFNVEDLLGVLILRGVLACGSHVAWGAVTGAAIMIAKGNQPLDGQVFTRPAFLTFFVFNIILHGIWDMEPVYLPVIIKYALLCASVWILIVICLNRGLSEINAISEISAENIGVEEAANVM